MKWIARSVSFVSRLGQPSLSHLASISQYHIRIVIQLITYTYSSYCVSNLDYCADSHSPLVFASSDCVRDLGGCMAKGRRPVYPSVHILQCLLYFLSFYGSSTFFLLFYYSTCPNVLQKLKDDMLLWVQLCLWWFLASLQWTASTLSLLFFSGCLNQTRIN